MLATGLRLGEALGVTWGDVDLGAGTVSVTRVKGQGLVANRVKSRASERGLLMPQWCVELLRARRVRLGGFDGAVFPDARGGWRDRSNVGKAFRQVREGSDFEWVKTHTDVQDGGDVARPERGQCANDRGPAGPFTGVHDARRVLRSTGQQRGQPGRP